MGVLKVHHSAIYYSIGGRQKFSSLYVICSCAHGTKDEMRTMTSSNKLSNRTNAIKYMATNGK